MAQTIVIRVLPMVLAQLLKLLTPDRVRYVVDKLLDALEKAIKQSENKIDDEFLPVIKDMRAAFNVPDED